MNKSVPNPEPTSDFQPISIPQDQLDFCAAVAELAKKHGCSEFTLNFRVSGFFTALNVPVWNNNIQAFWRRGRHSEPAKLHVSSTADFHVDI